ncbi:hypothetical protein D3C81_574350 [compost metagenome]
MFNLPRQLGTQIFRFVGVTGAVLQAVIDDAAHHRINRLWIGTQYLLYRHGAFRHPGAVIELICQNAERGKIEGFQRYAAALQLLQRPLKCLLGLGIAEKLELRRYCKAGGRGKTRRGGMGIDAGIGIGCVIAASQFGHQRSVCHRQGEYRHRVIEPTGGYHATVRQPALGRFQADNIVESGRDAP